MPSPAWPKINEARAKTIIDHLAGDGFLDRAIDANLELQLGAPFCLLRVKEDKLQLFENLGWGLPMLNRLDGLRKVLDGNAAKEMDLLVGQFSKLRTRWEKETIAPLIRQLGDDKLQVREAATQKLIERGEVAHRLLRATLQQPDLDQGDPRPHQNYPGRRSRLLWAKRGDP